MKCPVPSAKPSIHSRQHVSGQPATVGSHPIDDTWANTWVQPLGKMCLYVGQQWTTLAMKCHTLAVLYSPSDGLVTVWGLGFLGSGFKGSGFRVQGSGFRVQGSGFRVQGSAFSVQGSGFRVQGSGFKVQGSEFRVQGSRFKVQGLGFRV